MNKETACKLVAIQEKISNKQAKKYCDMGLVYSDGKKVKIARAMFDVNTKFNIMKFNKPKKILEDENIIAINKPAFYTSEECLSGLGKARLLHRLDKGTSGVLLICKNEEFRKQAIQEFKNKRVYKEYVAIVFGIVNEEKTISLPLLSVTKNSQIRTVVSDIGRSATTHITPLEIMGKKTKLKVVIEEGRTHQIRVHLANIGHGVVGDEIYAEPSRAKRLMLHSKQIKIFDYDIKVPEGEDFKF